jgi:hypothetical protein
MNPEQIIEVTIGLWGREVPPGQRPPALAADIVQVLRDEGWTFARCTCGEAGRHPRLHDESCLTFERWTLGKGS